MSHFEKIWWLEDGLVGGMRKPEHDDIVDLKENGLAAVASFLEGKDNLEEYEAAGLKWFWTPVEDDNVPTKEQVADFVKFVDELKEAGLPLAVHCKGGNGRAGTMLASYYITKTGKSAEEIITWMRDINPRAITAKVQEDFLASL